MTNHPARKFSPPTRSCTDEFDKDVSIAIATLTDIMDRHFQNMRNGINVQYNSEMYNFYNLLVADARQRYYDLKVVVDT